MARLTRDSTTSSCLPETFLGGFEGREGGRIPSLITLVLNTRQQSLGERVVGSEDGGITWDLWTRVGALFPWGAQESWDESDTVDQDLEAVDGHMGGELGGRRRARRAFAAKPLYLDFYIKSFKAL